MSAALRPRRPDLGLDLAQTTQAGTIGLIHLSMANPDLPIKVIWLDPGRTTGYATGSIVDGVLGAVSGQAKWSEYELYLQLKLARPHILGYESFQYRNKLDRADLYPVQMIGAINLYAQERANVHELTPVEVYTQTPSQGLSGQFSDTVLKQSKVYKINNPHANDAMRHLLYWFTFGGGYKYNTGGYEGLA